MAELTPAQEDQVAAAAGAAYATWLPAVQTATLAAYTRFGMMPDPAAIGTTGALWQQQITQLQQQALEPVAQASYEEESPDGTFTVGDALLVAAAAATTAFLFAQLGEVQSALVRLTLVTGGGAAAVAAAFRDFLNPASGFWTAKARQVAVTEGDRWAQAGTLSGARAAQARDGIRREKIWQTRRDDLVRDAHRHVQGQRRGLGEPFNVDGFPMQYPHDPIAPPDLVVNCRCWMRIVKRGVR
jgi:hypothetical protein